jgi:hypothetical protein
MTFPVNRMGEAMGAVKSDCPGATLGIHSPSACHLLRRENGFRARSATGRTSEFEIRHKLVDSCIDDFGGKGYSPGISF